MSILKQLKNAQKTVIQIANLSDTDRSSLVFNFANKLIDNTDKILAANKLDADKLDDTDPKKDRLLLTPDLIISIANDSKQIAKLDDPSGKIEINRTLDSGIKLQKITVPIGVIGMIYESRPNVTADAISLCLKSGNVAILRGGSDAANSNKAIIKIAHEVLKLKNLDPNIITLLPTDRKFV
jgi:glutamate-5-semialdehyde dehydrogenase